MTKMSPGRNLHHQAPPCNLGRQCGNPKRKRFCGGRGMKLFVDGDSSQCQCRLSLLSRLRQWSLQTEESDGAHNVHHIFQWTPRATLNLHNSKISDCVTLWLHGFAAVFCAAVARHVCDLGIVLKAFKPTCNKKSESWMQWTRVRHPAQVPVPIRDDLFAWSRIHNLEKKVSCIQGIIDTLVTTFPTGEECSSQPPSVANCFTWLQETEQKFFFHWEHSFCTSATSWCPHGVAKARRDLTMRHLESKPHFATSSALIWQCSAISGSLWRRENWMLQHATDNHVANWISLVGSALGIALPVSFFSQTMCTLFSRWANARHVLAAVLASSCS